MGADTNWRKAAEEAGLLKMLKYEFFEDFKGSDTLLFDGSAEELQSLVNVLHEVAVGKLSGQINLDQSRGFRPSRSTFASIQVVSEPINEVIVERAGESRLANWRLSPEDAVQAGELVKNVAANDGPAHEFLEDSGDIQVIAAKDEYSSDLFEDSR